MLRQSTPMPRETGFKRGPVDATCAQCGGPFIRVRPLQAVCGQVCAGRKVRAERLAREKAEREDTRARKAALKRIPDLLREAQVAFNRWTRERDAKQPCISCGASPPDLTQLHAGRDAGHYRSVGSAPHLRFHQDNVHAQCVKCNQWGAGMAVDYRLGLIARIGLPAVEALEADNAVHKWERDELIAIKATYRAKFKELKGTL